MVKMDLSTIKSLVKKDISKVMREDPFLKENLCDKEIKLNWYYNKNIVDEAFFAFLSKEGKNIMKNISIQLTALNRPNFEEELIFQLYKLPGDERNIKRLFSLQKKFGPLREKLGDDFFHLYPSYHAQFRAAGINLAIMKNHPKYKDHIFKLYNNILVAGDQRLITLYDLGDITIRWERKGSYQKSSLFRKGAVILMANRKKDYLSHYALGTPVSMMTKIFPLARSGGLGRKLEKRLDFVYKLSDDIVSERLAENSESISKYSFDEFFYPSLEGDSYVFRTEKYLNDCIYMKNLMRQRNAGSSVIKADDRDLMYAFNKICFLTNTRELGYLS